MENGLGDLSENEITSKALNTPTEFGLSPHTHIRFINARPLI